MKKTSFKNVYQFKITLKDTNPSVWRRMHVPENYTFWDLHVAIQDAMGWGDYHLHEFILKNPSDGSKSNIGIPDEENRFESDKIILADWKQNISEWFTLKNNHADYTYDFGDNWEHTIILEKILPRAVGVEYPICIDGKRACPPEDCGSYPGYESICAGTNEYQKEYKDYDPEYFDSKEVEFDDPQERLKEMLDLEREDNVEIKFNKEQFENILKLIFLGNWMVNAIRTDDIVPEFEEAENYIFSYADAFGFGNLADYDKELNKYFPSKKLEEDMGHYIDEYENDAFWDELTERLVKRDLIKAIEKFEGRTMDWKKRIKKEQPFLEKYAKEFEKNGIDRLEINEK